MNILLISLGWVLGVFVLLEVSVEVSARLCETWLRTVWSSSGVLGTAEGVEVSIGDRLRLQEYSGQFIDEASAVGLSQVLLESQPPVRVSAALLLQWYRRYHPAGGACHCFHRPSAGGAPG